MTKLLILFDIPFEFHLNFDFILTSNIVSSDVALHFE